MNPDLSDSGNTRYPGFLSDKNNRFFIVYQVHNIVTIVIKITNGKK